MLDQEKMLENKHWLASQPRPQHRQKTQATIAGIHVIKNSRIVTEIKAKF